MLGLMQIGAFIGPLTIVPGVIFWTKVTAHESKTFWMRLGDVNRAILIRFASFSFIFIHFRFIF